MNIPACRASASTPGPSILRSARLVALTLFLAGLAGISNALAQSDDFNDGNDTGWTRYDPLSAFGAPATFSFPSGGYRIQSAASPNPGLLGPGRAGSLRNDQSYSDFAVVFDLVDWNNTQDQAFGALARVSQAGLGTTDGYAFTYSTDGSIDISRINDETPTGLGSAAITLSTANDYRFVFTGLGTVLVGQVFNLADLSTPLATASGFDAAFATGVNGLLVFDNSPAGTGATDATFDNYFATVPEPSTAGLLLTGGVGLFFAALRGRSRSSQRTSL